MDWLSADVRWPMMGLARQALDATDVGDLEATVRNELARLGNRRRLPPGSSVAVAVGSRQIDRGPDIIRTVVETLRERDLVPFLVPAMGSHGGAIAEGQGHTLARLGVTAESVGAPIKASLEVTVLGALSDGTPVVMGRTAAQADAVLIVNRVKSHTKFFGRIESGLLKMTAIGLGQRQGAAALHAAAVDLGLEEVIRAGARVIIDSGKIWGGLAVVENGQGRVALIKGLTAAEIEAEEEKLLEQAKAMAPRIPFNRIDLLIVDQIGKDISGIGMDSKVTGRHRDVIGDFDLPPHPKRIYVRDLSPGSGGNALGIGLADACHARVEAKMDRDVTLTNALTSLSLEKAALPAIFDTDRRAVAACLASVGRARPDQVRLVHIGDTRSLATLHISRALFDEAAAAGLQLVGETRPLAFDPAGGLQSPF